jgi:hypothetical protein
MAAGLLAGSYHSRLSKRQGKNPGEENEDSN